MTDQLNKFSGLVIGDNPDEIMRLYDLRISVPPYVKYTHHSAHELKERYIKAISDLISSETNKLTVSQKQLLDANLSAITDMSDEDYFATLTSGLQIDEDGNAVSTQNPKGKFIDYSIGGDVSIPLILNNGDKAYSSPVEFVDWGAMINQKRRVYELAWDLTHGKPPVGEEELTIFKNMSPKQDYFKSFSSKEDYVRYCTAYWTSAVITKDSWVDMSVCTDPKSWITSFYDKFISCLNGTDVITVIEFVLPK